MEYRVVGENFRGEAFASETPFRDQIAAEANLRGWKTGGARSGRIQKRTVVTTPWEDVDVPGETDQELLYRLADALQDEDEPNCLTRGNADAVLLRRLATRISSERKQFEEDLLSDEAVEAVAKARRERGRGDTLPWAELLEIAKAPIRAQVVEDLQAALSVSREGGR